MTHVIALSGYSGVGKDTVAKLLELKYGYHRMAFADKLRDLVLKTDPVIGTDSDGQDIHLSQAVHVMHWDGAKRVFPDVRKMLQHVGDGAREVIDAKVWIDPVVKAAGHWEKVVITDVRYPNELDALRLGKFNTIVSVRLERHGVGPVNDHVSETGKPHADIIYNTSSCGLEDMPGAVDNLMVTVRKLQKQKVEGRYDTILAKLATNIKLT